MSQSSWIGKSLNGRYLIEELLGQGGMSAVYKATDPNLKRVVAIKIIHTHLSNDPDFVKRFEEEATAVAQLRHSNIVQVYDYNNDSDSFYMVLEFVPGETLQDYLKRLNASDRGLSITQAIEYMASICDAVDYAHQRGLIHRDIKPANLMINVLGQAILMDFGIAKILGGQRHTATGAVVGTAMYMSPEQIKGEHPDRRTDIYSLGVTLFEMVSGHPPFEHDSAMTLMMMHINDPVPDPRNLNPEVPDDLVAVINNALAKDPNERYQTAAQMAAALRNVLARIKSGTPAEAPATDATVVDQPVMSFPAPDSTFVEVPSAISDREGPRAGSAPPLGAAASGPPVSIPEPKAPEPASPRPSKIFGLSVPLFAGGIAGLIGLACLIGGGIIFYGQFFGGGGGDPTATETLPAVALVDAPESTATATSTLTPAPPTLTPTATLTPTITNTPSPTVPAGIPFSRINAITIDDQNRYVVEYETFEFTETLPGMHVHFFFDTVAPENAGVPGSGPWILYGGPRPFTGYGVSDRPGTAYQMCILVANPNHSVQANSGDCMDLP